MKHWQRRVNITLLGALLIALAASLSPQVMFAAILLGEPEGLKIRQAAGPSGPEDWIATPAARARSQNGLCPDGFECLELCVSGEGTGNFQCWPDNMW